MTLTTTRRLTALALTSALAVSAVACGGGDSGGADEVTATLAIISTNIETDRDARGFEAATEGETLTVGDQVRTDPTGFAELTYHDGSWQRIENSATLTIDELTNAGDTNTVRTSVDVGDTWNRVETLTEPDDAYTLDTPVATAAVRGTAFATQCPTTDECTFSVIDGTVEITPDTGDPVTLTAGQQITITTDTPPPAPETPGVDTLSQDPFIAENLTLDQTKTTDTSDNGDGEGASGGASSSEVAGSWTATATNIRVGELRGDLAGASTSIEEDGSSLVRVNFVNGNSSGYVGVFVPFDGTVECGADGCELTPSAADAGGPYLLLAEKDGALVLSNRVTRDTQQCGFPAPPGDWEVSTSGDTITFTASAAHLSCEAQLLVDVVLTRS